MIIPFLSDEQDHPITSLEGLHDSNFDLVRINISFENQDFTVPSSFLVSDDFIGAEMIIRAHPEHWFQSETRISIVKSCEFRESTIHLISENGDNVTVLRDNTIGKFSCDRDRIFGNNSLVGILGESITRGVDVMSITMVECDINGNITLVFGDGESVIFHHRKILRLPDKVSEMITQHFESDIFWSGAAKQVNISTLITVNFNEFWEKFLTVDTSSGSITLHGFREFFLG